MKILLTAAFTVLAATPAFAKMTAADIDAILSEPKGYGESLCGITVGITSQAQLLAKFGIPTSVFYGSGAWVNPATPTTTGETFKDATMWQYTMGGSTEPNIRISFAANIVTDISAGNEDGAPPPCAGFTGTGSGITEAEIYFRDTEEQVINVFGQSYSYSGHDRTWQQVLTFTDNYTQMEYMDGPELEFRNGKLILIEIGDDVR